MKQLPEDFLRLISESLDDANCERLIEAINEDAPTSIRLNPLKTEAATHEGMLMGAAPVLWNKDAYYLSERPQFTFDPLLHCGCYYVQEASSMYIGSLLNHFVKQINTESGKSEEAPVTVLDACAAPGGKTTLALSSLPEGSLVVANEYVRQRSQILSENLIKWGNPNIIVTNSDTKDFRSLPSFFDIILCDAPCSGEGMFRKDDKAIEDWSLANVSMCQQRQREIIKNLWNALRPGGLFLYSTCTFNHLEDEDNVNWIEETFSARKLDLPSTLPIPNGHFYPHLVKGEGFFVAAFIKEEGDDNETSFSRKNKKDKDKAKSKTQKLPKELKEWLCNPSSFTLEETAAGTYTAFPTIHFESLKAVRNATKVIHSGIQLGSLKGKNLQPSHNLAMSLCLNKAAFPMAEIDEEQAIAYLRTEAITLSPSMPTGYVLITYKDHPLGFVKNIGNRANNLYPQEWRIKSTYIPKNK